MSTSPRPINARQRAISLYFQSKPSFWKYAYERQNLQSAIYQSRRDSAITFFGSLQLPPDAEILEVGCGAGVLATEVARGGYRVRSIDSAPVMLEMTRQRAAEAGVADRVIVEPGDIHNLAFPDGSLDVVFALGVMPWVPALPKPLAEVHRVLKPGGHFIFTIDNRNRLSHRLDLLLPVRRLAGRTLRSIHLRDDVVSRTYTVQETNDELEAAGFELIDDETLGFGPFTLAGFRIVPDRLGLYVDRALHRKSDRFQFLRTGGAQYVVLAKRSGLTGNYYDHQHHHSM
jgi:ubiquinone/menaquinone biosynthesis C-methylase UbiE